MSDTYDWPEFLADDPDTVPVDAALPAPSPAARAQGLVVVAAFWAAFADALKIIGEMAKTEAVKVCDEEEREKTTGKTPQGTVLGTLRRDPDKTERVWRPSVEADLLAYIERAYPEEVVEIPAHYEMVPARREVRPVFLVALLKRLTDGGVDSETGNDLSDMLTTARTSGRWVLTKDAAAKARVLAVLREIAAAGMPLPTEARKMIEGDK